MNSSLSCPFHWWYWRVNVAGSKQPTALFIFTYSHFNMLLLVICESIWTSQAVCMSLTISGNLLIVIVKLAGGVQLCCLCFLFMYLFILWPRPPFFFEPLIFLIQHQNIYHNYKSFKSWLRMIFLFLSPNSNCYCWALREQTSRTKCCLLRLCFTAGLILFLYYTQCQQWVNSPGCLYKLCVNEILVEWSMRRTTPSGTVDRQRGHSRSVSKHILHE